MSKPKKKRLYPIPDPRALGSKGMSLISEDEERKLAEQAKEVALEIIELLHKHELSDAQMLWACLLAMHGILEYIAEKNEIGSISAANILAYEILKVVAERNRTT